MQNVEIEQRLTALAKTKDRNSIDEAADASACDEDSDMMLQPMLEGIYTGLGRSKKIVCVVELDDYNSAIFIDKNYKAIESRINECDDLKSEKDFNLAVEGLKSEIGDAFMFCERDSEDMNQITVYVKESLSIDLIKQFSDKKFKLRTYRDFSVGLTVVKDKDVKKFMRY